MHHLVLLYGDETTATEPGSPEFDAEMAGYIAFGELAGGAIRGGAALHLTSTARTIRRHSGGTVTVTDGPFAETTEALGGYYVLEADNLDDVIEMVRHIPATFDPRGASEIRPVTMLLPSPEDPRQQDWWLATMHGEETAADVPDTPEWEAAAVEHHAFAAAAGDAIVGGAAVQTAATATTVRVREGEVVVSDGPFSEVIEIVGGYYVLRGGADEVLELARRIPVNPGGAVELRPVMDLGDEGG